MLIQTCLTSIRMPISRGQLIQIELLIIVKQFHRRLSNVIWHMLFLKLSANDMLPITFVSEVWTNQIILSLPPCIHMPFAAFKILLGGRRTGSKGNWLSKWYNNRPDRSFCIWFNGLGWCNAGLLPVCLPTGGYCCYRQGIKQSEHRRFPVHSPLQSTSSASLFCEFWQSARRRRRASIFVCQIHLCTYGGAQHIDIPSLFLLFPSLSHLRIYLQTFQALSILFFLSLSFRPVSCFPPSSPFMQNTWQQQHSTSLLVSARASDVLALN